MIVSSIFFYIFSAVAIGSAFKVLAGGARKTIYQTVCLEKEQQRVLQFVMTTFTYLVDLTTEIRNYHQWRG